jgi:hypothetical protein
MITTDVPTYLIDLGRDEATRWQEVISHEMMAARRVVQEAGSQFERVPELLRWVFARLYLTCLPSLEVTSSPSLGGGPS